MMNDEIIAEVRAIKDAIGVKYNYDLRALFEEIKSGEAELEAKGIHLIPPPAEAAGLPGTALQRGKARRGRPNNATSA
jgi:hypothetical protein